MTDPIAWLTVGGARSDDLMTEKERRVFTSPIGGRAMTPRTDPIVFCDHCGPCERRGCNEHEVVTGPAQTPRTDREAAEAQITAEFLRRVRMTDHPYSRTPEPCCAADPSEHLGYGGNPWTLPTVDEMRELLR